MSHVGWGGEQTTLYNAWKPSPKENKPPFIRTISAVNLSRYRIRYKFKFSYVILKKNILLSLLINKNVTSVSIIRQ